MATLTATVTDTGGNTATGTVDITVQGETWDNTLTGVQPVGNVVVPAGESWLIGAGVEITGNLRTVGGTIAMRPGSTLKFLGADPDAYVGGGLTFGAGLENDIGLWVTDGVLDIQGTPKVGWNRTGTDPTWLAGDELWISPTDVGDYNPRPWSPGGVIPRIPIPALVQAVWLPADWMANGIPAEVMNVTRDIVIEGAGHIHIHSTLPQRVEYVTLRGLGVSNLASNGVVLGRYALHFHMSGDGSRGTIVRGIAAIDSLGEVFVPHVSHGITVEDVVSVNSYGTAFTWDGSDRTDDILVDGLCVSGVHMPRAVSGKSSYVSAIDNRGGDNMEMKNSVASGCKDTKLSHGFDWPSKGDNEGTALWNFHDNVSHNNRGASVRFWFNNSDPHLVERVVTYRNRVAGIETGAYTNSVRYQDILSFEDQDAAIVHHSSTTGVSSIDNRGAFYDRVLVVNSVGPAVETRAITLAGSGRVEWVDCILEGTPKVFVTNSAKNPFLALFHHCGLVPDDIVFEIGIPVALNGSSILIEHEDGTNWEITVVNEQKVVTVL